MGILLSNSGKLNLQLYPPQEKREVKGREVEGVRNHWNPWNPPPHLRSGPEFLRPGSVSTRCSVGPTIRKNTGPGPQIET